MQRNYRTLFGVVLILAGSLLLAQRNGLIGGDWNDAILTLVFGVGTIYFASLFFESRSRWWAALVAFIFLGITAENLLEIFFPSVPGFYSGASILFLMGVGFLAVYFLDRQMWWAIIPSGALLSLTGVVIFDEVGSGLPFDTAGILFVGLGLTFLVLYFLPVDGPRLTWAIYPALALVAFGLFVGVGERELWDVIWPALIVLLGLYFVWGAFRRR